MSVCVLGAARTLCLCPSSGVACRLRGVTVVVAVMLVDSLDNVDTPVGKFVCLFG